MGYIALASIIIIVCIFFILKIIKRKRSKELTEKLLST